MAKNRKTYVPKDLAELAKLGTHELNARRAPMLQGRVERTARGGRKFVATPDEKRVQHNGLVCEAIVGATVLERDDRVERRYKKMLAGLDEKRRFEIARGSWMATQLTPETATLPTCQPPKTMTMEELYSSAYLEV